MKIDDMIGKIICGDCLEIMKTFPDNSVDLVLTDPPYNVSRDNNFSSMNRYNKYKGIDFGEWDWNFNQTEWLKELPRICKNNCNIFIFNSWQNLKEISDYLNKIGFMVKRPAVIKKKNPIPANRERLFVNSFEFGIWATKGNWIFNREQEYEELYFETVIGAGIKTREENHHPTKKDIKIMEKLIRILSNENDIILDSFLGSGTTAVACEKLNRRWIGIEISPEYCKIAQERIDRERNQLKMKL